MVDAERPQSLWPLAIIPPFLGILGWLLIGPTASWTFLLAPIAGGLATGALIYRQGGRWPIGSTVLAALLTYVYMMAIFFIELFWYAWS